MGDPAFGISLVTTMDDLRHRFASLDRMPVPKQYAAHERPDHPYLRDYAGSFVYDRFFDSVKLQKAIAAYYGLCTFLDDNIGKVLRTLDATGLAETTRVLYTSDHGDNLGARGLWGKSTMYEEVAGVPLIINDHPEIARGVQFRPRHQ